jgi:hypothetical protein
MTNCFLLFSNISKAKSIFVFFAFLLILGNLFSQPQSKDGLLNEAQRSWVKQDKLAQKKFESLLINQSQDERLKSICHYYLGLIASRNQDFTKAKDEFLKSIAYKFKNENEVIFRPELDKDSILTGQNMTAKKMRYNTYENLSNIYSNLKDGKEALKWLKKKRQEEYLNPDANTLTFHGSKQALMQANNFMLSNLYDKLQMYDSSSLILIAYCLGKSREATFHLAFLKQRMLKGFSTQKLKVESTKMIESITEKSKINEGVKVKWFDQEMILYSTEIPKLKSKESIIDFIKNSDLYKFMQGT